MKILTPFDTFGEKILTPFDTFLKKILTPFDTFFVVSLYAIRDFWKVLYSEVLYSEFTM